MAPGPVSAPPSTPAPIPTSAPPRVPKFPLATATGTDAPAPRTPHPVLSGYGYWRNYTGNNTEFPTPRQRGSAAEVKGTGQMMRLETGMQDMKVDLATVRGRGTKGQGSTTATASASARPSAASTTATRTTTRSVATQTEPLSPRPSPSQSAPSALATPTRNQAHFSPTNATTTTDPTTITGPRHARYAYTQVRCRPRSHNLGSCERVRNRFSPADWYFRYTPRFSRPYHQM